MRLNGRLFGEDGEIMAAEVYQLSQATKAGKPNGTHIVRSSLTSQAPCPENSNLETDSLLCDFGVFVQTDAAELNRSELTNHPASFQKTTRGAYQSYR